MLALINEQMTTLGKNDKEEVCIVVRGKEDYSLSILLKGVPF